VSVRVNAARSLSPVGPGAYLDELYRHRGVAWVLVARELRARYRGSALGYAWTLLNPILHLAIYTLVFSVFLRVEVEDYPVFVFAGLLPWTWLSASLASATPSIVDGAHLVTRSLLPPQLLPSVRVAENGINLLLTLPVLIAVAVALGRPPGAALLALPVLIAAELLLVQGLALAAAALCARYRDVEFLVRHALTFGLFLTPVLYPLSAVPEPLRPLVLANPMTPLALAWQDVLYRDRFPELGHVGLAIGFGVLALVAGISVFARLRDRLVEDL
jgi:ABC-type polysaccharide/polyol phosphate export permease